METLKVGSRGFKCYGNQRTVGSDSGVLCG